MSNTGQQFRAFTEEFLRDVAGLVIETGHSIAAVAKELNLDEQTLDT